MESKKGSAYPLDEFLVAEFELLQIREGPLDADDALADLIWRPDGRLPADEETAHPGVGHSHEGIAKWNVNGEGYENQRGKIL